MRTLRLAEAVLAAVVAALLSPLGSVAQAPQDAALLSGTATIPTRFGHPLASPLPTVLCKFLELECVNPRVDEYSKKANDEYEVHFIDVIQQDGGTITILGFRDGNGSTFFQSSPQGNLVKIRRKKAGQPKEIIEKTQEMQTKFEKEIDFWNREERNLAGGPSDKN